MAIGKSRPSSISSLILLSISLLIKIRQTNTHGVHIQDPTASPDKFWNYCITDPNASNVWLRPVETKAANSSRMVQAVHMFFEYQYSLMFHVQDHDLSRGEIDTSLEPIRLLSNAYHVDHRIWRNFEYLSKSKVYRNFTMKFQQFEEYSAEHLNIPENLESESQYCSKFQSYQASFSFAITESSFVTVFYDGLLRCVSQPFQDEKTYASQKHLLRLPRKRGEPPRWGDVTSAGFYYNKLFEITGGNVLILSFFDPENVPSNSQPMGMPRKTEIFKVSPLPNTVIDAYSKKKGIEIPTFLRDEACRKRLIENDKLPLRTERDIWQVSRPKPIQTICKHFDERNRPLLFAPIPYNPMTVELGISSQWSAWVADAQSPDEPNRILEQTLLKFVFSKLIPNPEDIIIEATSDCILGNHGYPIDRPIHVFLRDATSLKAHYVMVRPSYWLNSLKAVEGKDYMTSKPNQHVAVPTDLTYRFLTKQMFVLYGTTYILVDADKPIIEDKSPHQILKQVIQLPLVAVCSDPDGTFYFFDKLRWVTVVHDINPKNRKNFEISDELWRIHKFWYAEYKPDYNLHNNPYRIMFKRIPQLLDDPNQDPSMAPDSMSSQPHEMESVSNVRKLLMILGIIAFIIALVLLVIYFGYRNGWFGRGGPIGKRPAISSPATVRSSGLSGIRPSGASSGFSSMTRRSSVSSKPSSSHSSFRERSKSTSSSRGRRQQLMSVPASSTAGVASSRPLSSSANSMRPSNASGRSVSASRLVGSGASATSGKSGVIMSSRAERSLSRSSASTKAASHASGAASKGPASSTPLFSATSRNPQR